MRLFKIFSIFILLMATAVYYHEHSSRYQTISGKIFGTYYNIKINTLNKNNKLENKVKVVLNKVNAAMSMFDPESEISRINRETSGRPLKLSPSLGYLLQNAAKVYAESNGAFDPTVGPLVNLWGFGVNTVTKTPSEQQIAEILPHVGFNKLHFDDNFTTLQKTDAQVYIDLSAIAKGYGVDRIAEMLHSEGYHDFVIEIGGEVRVSGTRDGINPWNIGVARPSESGFRNAFVLDLTDYAVATSGDYRNFFYSGGKRYAHTISARTGRPVEHNLASVTVFYPTCMLADAYATAIMALGEKDGLELAEKLNLPALLFIRGQDDSITMETSTAARNLIGE